MTRSAMAPPLVLVVDDEPDLVELVTLTLSRMQLATQSAGDVAGAKKLLKAQHFDLCLTDMRLPDGDGLDLLEWIAAHCPERPVAMITAYGNVEAAVRALKPGAFDFVSKPVDLSVLRRLVSTALKLSRVGRRRRSDAHRHAAHRRRAGDGAAARDDRARRAQPGAGAHLRRIRHRQGTRRAPDPRLGPRADGPFVPVNCGAIPSELMESEFFGHKRGSFTGAVTDKDGLFQAAEGGTLFLDEVAELPLHMQVKLLRVIQEKAVRPIGAQREVAGRRAHPVGDAQEPRRAGRAGEFRQDLFYRINVIELRVPPLRERAEDIPELADAIVHRLARRLGTEPPPITPGGARACCRLLVSRATCASSRTCSSARWRCATRGASTSATCSCAPRRAPTTRRRPRRNPLAQMRAQTGFDNTADPRRRSRGALGDQLEDVERAAIIKALEAGALQQDRGGESARRARFRLVRDLADLPEPLHDRRRLTAARDQPGEDLLARRRRDGARLDQPDQRRERRGRQLQVGQLALFQFAQELVDGPLRDAVHRGLVAGRATVASKKSASAWLW